MSKILKMDDHTFEIVDFYPLGYQIWNIGKNMPDGYVPLCRLSAYQPFPGGRNIETDTLKAVRLEGAQKILAVATAGFNTAAKLEKYIADNEHLRPGDDWYPQLMRCKAALEPMRQLEAMR